MRSRLANLVLALGSLVFGLLLAEGLLALFFPQGTLRSAEARRYPIFAPSEVLPYSLRPGAEATLKREEFEVPIRINSLGYRGGPFELEKGEHFRILVAGDSFTFGYGCRAEEAYPARLQAELERNRPEQRFQVVNAGFAACYYPDTYYLYLKRLGLELDPDLVVLGFFVGNDIDHLKAFENRWLEIDEQGLPDRIDNRRTHVVDGDLVPRRLHWRHRVPVVRNSHLAQLMISFARERRAGVGAAERPEAYHNPFVYREPYPERTEFAVREVQRLLLATAELTRARSIPLLVLMIPAREQVYPDLYQFERYPLTARYDLDKPQRIFAGFFERREIDYLDLLPILRTQPRVPQLYFEKDGHWTAAGHQVAARALAGHLLADSDRFLTVSP